MKFSTKLVLSISCIALLLVAIGVASQYLNGEVRNRVLQESKEAVQELKLSGNMGLKLYKSLINTQYFLEDRYRKSLNENFSDNELNTEIAQQRVLEAVEDIQTSIDEFQSLSQGHNHLDSTHIGNSELLQKLKLRVNIYSSLLNQLFELTEEDYDDGKEFFTITIEPYFRTNLLPLVEELKDKTQMSLDEEITQLNSDLRSASRKLTFATIGALLLALILVYYLYQSIAKPLKELSLAAQHIGEGNLDERIEISSNDEIGQLGKEFNKMAENLSKTTVSKDFMDDIIESMADALIVSDNENYITRINSSTIKMLGYNGEELIGEHLSKLFAEDDLRSILSSNSTDEFKNYETTLVSKTGKFIPVSLSRALIFNSNRQSKGTVCVAVDITKRKEAERQITKSLKEKEILLAEIHHRVKNNLAVISGMLQMQMWETEDEAAETVLKDSQLRVQSIALIHEKLYQSESLSYIEFDKYLRDLIQAISSTYLDSDRDIEIVTELEEIPLNVNQAIPFSLLINELVVNAYKHAFRKQDSGKIKLDLQNKGDLVFLRISDNGSGLDEDFNPSEENSLGMTLVNTLIGQLEGSIKSYNDDGATFEISFHPEEVV
ncbi:MAG: histidine kinase dimerization/phosphoacceptor domain -containing protein [Balneolaceae bacterium]|nr:histidine kinase dimerization/phosphoacceptor domain -containing protein [Balneolaceae bacterium]